MNDVPVRADVLVNESMSPLFAATAEATKAVISLQQFSNHRLDQVQSLCVGHTTSAKRTIGKLDWFGANLTA